MLGGCGCVVVNFDQMGQWVSVGGGWGPKCWEPPGLQVYQGAWAPRCTPDAAPGGWGMNLFTNPCTISASPELELILRIKIPYKDKNMLLGLHFGTPPIALFPCVLF